MKWTLTAAYCLNTLAFIPLFIVVMALLSRQFNSLYLDIRVKVFVIFIVFLAVVIFRFICYLCLSFAHIQWLTVESVQSEIPFYISEISIALCFMYFLISLYTRQMDKEEDSRLNESRSRHSSTRNYVQPDIGTEKSSNLEDV